MDVIYMFIGAAAMLFITYVDNLEGAFAFFIGFFLAQIVLNVGRFVWRELKND